jgi:hypothetical protein
MGGCGAESREGAVWGEGDRDQGGHGVRGRFCVWCFVTRRSETAREGSGCPPNRTIPTPGWIFFSFFSFVSFFTDCLFLPRTGVLFSRKAARCERCSPWQKRKYLGVHVRRIRSCSFWTFFYCFFSFQKKLTAGNRKGRTGKLHRARSGTTGYGGGR